MNRRNLGSSATKMEHFPSDSEPETRGFSIEKWGWISQCVLPIVIFAGKLSAKLRIQTAEVCRSQALLITSGNSGREVQLLFSVLCQTSGVSPVPAERCLYQPTAIFGTDCQSCQKT